ncbi:MAG: DUF4190 domain-containing protein [Armatimonadota bacterium]|nr:MAG: DUF4190 domain-containing protein [Armatimonadota bacterium]
MVCGILSLLCCCLDTMRVPLAVAAVGLGLFALNSRGPDEVRQASRPYALAGIITGVLAAVLILLTLALTFAFGISRALNPWHWHRGLFN